MPENPKPFIIHEAKTGTLLPVVFDSPHSGSLLPAGFQHMATDRGRDLLRDSYIDLLLMPANDYGIPVLANPVDRIVIDPNSAEDELDPSMFEGAWDRPHRITKNVSVRGLGLITSSLLDDAGRLQPIFNEHSRPTTADIKNRIDTYYRPYYQALKSLMDQSMKEHGLALHFNFHSTPGLAFGHTHHGRLPDIILGDLNGKTCHPLVTKLSAEFFRQQGLSVQTNLVFTGGALIRSTHDRPNGRHSLQIELNRDLICDPKTLALDPVRAGKTTEIIRNYCEFISDFTKNYKSILK
jgi:N-formylglutamate deformylase